LIIIKIDIKKNLEQNSGHLTERYNEGKLHWTTEKGDKILIQKLSNSHLLNCINWIKRTHSRKHMLQILETEKEKRKLK